MMAVLLELKEQLKSIYSRFDVYIVPVLKFALAFVTLSLINSNLGYMTRLDNIIFVLITALVCSFMPANITVVFASVFILAHIYSLSMECAVVVFVVFMLMYLLYFRFSPGDSIALILTPVCFALRIPYAVPLAMGFVGTPLSAVSVGCGVVVHYILRYIIVNSSVISNLEADSTVQKFKFVIDNLLSNKEMVVMVMAFAVTIVLVYTIRRLSVNYSWTIALIVGTIVDVIFVLVGDMMLSLSVSIGGVIIGSIISLVLILVLQFFVFSVDYSRTENLQFEDDEYYYYVKAVPKMSVAVSEKKVKHISSSAADPVRVSRSAGNTGSAQSREAAVRRQASRPATPSRPAAPSRPSASARPSAPARPSASSRPAAPARPQSSVSADTVSAEGWRRLDSPTKALSDD